MKPILVFSGIARGQRFRQIGFFLILTPLLNFWSVPDPLRLRRTLSNSVLEHTVIYSEFRLFFDVGNNDLDNCSHYVCIRV